MLEMQTQEMARNRPRKFRDLLLLFLPVFSLFISLLALVKPGDADA
jgi:hypothetical protein